jgi:hypothetical protein
MYVLHVCIACMYCMYVLHVFNDVKVPPAMASKVKLSGLSYLRMSPAYGDPSTCMHVMSYIHI